MYVPFSLPNKELENGTYICLYHKSTVDYSCLLCKGKAFKTFLTSYPCLRFKNKHYFLTFYLKMEDLIWIK